MKKIIMEKGCDFILNLHKEKEDAVIKELVKYKFN